LKELNNAIREHVQGAFNLCQVIEGAAQEVEVEVEAEEKEVTTGGPLPASDAASVPPVSVYFSFSAGGWLFC